MGKCCERADKVVDCRVGRKNCSYKGRKNLMVENFQVETEVDSNYCPKLSEHCDLVTTFPHGLSGFMGFITHVS